RAHTLLSNVLIIFRPHNAPNGERAGYALSLRNLSHKRDRVSCETLVICLAEAEKVQPVRARTPGGSVKRERNVPFLRELRKRAVVLAERIFSLRGVQQHKRRELRKLLLESFFKGCFDAAIGNSPLSHTGTLHGEVGGRP